MEHTYRSVVLTAPEQLELRQTGGRPPGPGEVLLAPDGVGICGTDLELVRGHLSYQETGFSTFPLVLGHEWTATVVTVGDDVAGVAPGDRVVGECALGCGSCDLCAAGLYQVCPDRRETGVADFDGAMAERMLFPARYLHVLPDTVDRRDAALVEPLAVSLRGVKRLFGSGGQETPGPTLVIGGGTIGVLSAMAARALAATEVVVVEPDQGRGRWARDAGFDTVTTPTGRWPHVVEASGNVHGIGVALDALGLAGRLVLLGMTGQQTPVDLDRVITADQTLLGSLSSPGVWPEAIELVSSGQVRPGRLITHEFGLDDAAAAFAQVTRREPGTFKVIIDPQR